MKKAMWVAAQCVALSVLLSCNDGMSSARDYGKEKGEKASRSQRTVIDAAEYVDFTVEKNDAGKARKEDMLYTLRDSTYKNGNSSIAVDAREGKITISSDNGFFNGKWGCQVYGEFALETMAASADCLYIRRDQSRKGRLRVDGNMFENDAIPDLSVCLPLYGYSRNRIEVSPVMDGYIAMPSGTYWKK